MTQWQKMTKLAGNKYDHNQILAAKMLYAMAKQVAVSQFQDDHAHDADNAYAAVMVCYLNLADVDVALEAHVDACGHYVDVAYFLIKAKSRCEDEAEAEAIRYTCGRLHFEWMQFIKANQDYLPEDDVIRYELAWQQLERQDFTVH